MNAAPIIFGAESVKATLSGKKTVTRRVVKPVPRVDEKGRVWLYRSQNGHEGMAGNTPGRVPQSVAHEFCRYGSPGEYLWVKEAWRTHIDLDHLKPSDLPQDTRIIYEADDSPSFRSDGRYRNPLHMPRWASRLLLKLDDVWVERLHDMSQETLVAEGVGGDFVNHWNRLNAKRGFPWKSNPWVWCLKFRLLEAEDENYLSGL